MPERGTEPASVDVGLSTRWRMTEGALKRSSLRQYTQVKDKTDITPVCH